jgi:hypothetical protein
MRRNLVDPSDQAMQLKKRGLRKGLNDTKFIYFWLIKQGFTVVTVYATILIS